MTEATNFVSVWTTKRWLPKEERSKEYYVNEYRFMAGDKVTAFTYKFTSSDLNKKEEKKIVDLLLKHAMSSLSSAAAALITTTYLLFN